MLESCLMEYIFTLVCYQRDRSYFGQTRIERIDSGQNESSKSNTPIIKMAERLLLILNILTTGELVDICPHLVYYRYIMQG